MQEVMKKIYIVPCMESMKLCGEQMLAGSVTSDNDYGIGYGGVDSDGSLDPAAKQNVFEDSPFE